MSTDFESLGRYHYALEHAKKAGERFDQSIRTLSIQAQRADRPGAFLTYVNFVLMRERLEAASAAHTDLMHWAHEANIHAPRCGKPAIAIVDQLIDE